MKLHKCKAKPKNTEVAWEFNCWTLFTERDAIDIHYCPFCGEKLGKPKVTHLVFRQNMMDAEDTVVFVKGKRYEVLSDDNGNYEVSDDDGGISRFSKTRQRYLYEVIYD